VPKLSDEISVDADRSALWAYAKEVDNWARLFPGYQRHLLVDTDHYFWQVRGEAGAWSRLIEFDVYVTAWSDPEDVRFRLESRSEPVQGTGRFYTRSDQTGTVMGFELDLQATGSAAPMINALLKKYVTELSGPFLAALRQDLEERGRAVEDGPVVSVPYGTPGVVIVEYRAPRTSQVEDWWRRTRLPALLGQSAVRSVRRLELTITGALAEYRELIETSDMAATITSEREALAGGPGVDLLRPPYGSRQVFATRPARLSRLLGRIGGRRR
jgi:carbon monoxide dehydrogenase subunit G